MKTSLIQMNSKSADIEDNLEKIKFYIAEEKEAELIIFPELAITGNNCRDYFSEVDFIERQNKALEEITEMSYDKDI
ncbi:MAG: nitrilase-related carbon-nitrogen hydrolase, partial [Candidatus Gastranaerophilaceae bacterium]